jgi:hypothetical protein
MVAGPYLMFPKFDSSLLFVNELNYAGIDTIIPKWVENLKYANSVTFNSKRIMEIKCDICLMNELQLLDISFSDLYVDEVNHFREFKKYKKLENFLTCKPNLKLKYELPPK